MSRTSISLLVMFIAGVMSVVSDNLPASATRGPFLLVANQGDRSLSILDPIKGEQVVSIPEGGITAHEVASSPDGREMVVIDTALGKVDFGHGVCPHCVLYNAKDGLLYVTTELDNSVTLIDPGMLKIVASIPTGQAESHMLAISSDGKRRYTANVGPGTVSVLDLEACKVLATIRISDKTQRISITPDDRLVSTADQTRPQLAAIDAASKRIQTWVALPEVGYGTASQKLAHGLNGSDG